MSAYNPNAPWSASEKTDLLINILHGAIPDLPSFLLRIILQDKIVPKWFDIPLPKGRSIHSCQIVFQEMQNSLGTQPWPLQPLQGVPYTNIAPAVPQKRSFSDNEPSFPTQRPLQPRPPARSTDSPVPPVTNGESPVFLRTMGPDTPSEIPRKRGRPSRAEAEERDRRLALEGKTHQPKKRPSKKLRPSTGVESLELKTEDVPVPALQTPVTLTPAPREESSSGKRRSRRRTGEDASTASGIAPDEVVEREITMVESPSDRLLASHREREVTVTGPRQNVQLGSESGRSQEDRERS